MQRAAMAGAARCVGRCSALHLLPRLSAPNLLPPCPPLSMGEKSLLHGSVTSSPRDRVDSCIVLWWLFCRRETHFPLGWKFSSISKSPILHGAASSSSYGRKTIGSQVFVASPTACQESGFAQEPIYIMYRRVGGTVLPLHTPPLGGRVEAVSAYSAGASCGVVLGVPPATDGQPSWSQSKRSSRSTRPLEGS